MDDHHTVEDVGIALGQAFAAALGDKRGIVRYGNMILPMDESLILTAVDLSGRGAKKSSRPKAAVSAVQQRLWEEQQSKLSTATG